MSTEATFGQQVKERRRELQLTQDELARRVACAPVTLRKIEYDDLRPSVQIAERLAMALNISLEERAAFVRLARAQRVPEPPRPTPAPALEEFGAEDLSGRAIRGYALGERIGSGGMGAVYRAVQPIVEREVAIKIILPQYANHPEFIRRFEAEAQLVARLEHPHIVPLYDYWREPNIAFLVMRLLRGGSLRHLLESGPLPLELVLRMMEQVGTGLGAAHRAGVIHRDLKPANVLLDEDQNAYLADFGIAKNLANPNLEDQTQVEAILGSPSYISPEQIRSEVVRPESDIYCLGVVLFELLTGHLPFSGPTPIEVMHQHLSAPLPPLAARRTGLPGTLDAVIEHATAKDPLKRYHDTDSLLVDLRRAIRGEAQVAKHIATVPELPPLTAADNPYKGLRAFGEADAHDFFGREALIQQLLIRMGEGGDLSRFLAVVGPSGSGKSSVVGAGLVPALRGGALPGSENWYILQLTPGAHPFEELETALLRIAVSPPGSLPSQHPQDKRGLLRAVDRCLPEDPSVELVLVIDQFEEVFTLGQDEAVRAHLLDSLVTAALDERSRLRMVITLRADFIDRPLEYVDFGELLRQRSEFVLPLTPDELERAIIGPAERLGLQLETGLVPAMLYDVGGQPGVLPLLQFALTELFEKREGRWLTRAAYQSIGGVLGALGRRAEDVFTSLDEAGQDSARQLFLRLVNLGEGAEDTRRRVLREEIAALKGSQPSATQNTIARFGNARLLTFDRDPITRGPTMEVAHEAILREWTRLRDWLNESRSVVRLQRQLATAASEWERAQRDVSFLLSGAKLAQYEGLRVNSPVALTQAETDYLEASIDSREQRQAEEAARHERELETVGKLAEAEKARAEEQTRSVKRLRLGAALLAGALALASIAAIFAGVFANRNGTLAIQNASVAGTAQAEAQSRATAEANAVQQRAIAQQQALLARARELSAASLTNLSVDPERSILLALQAVNETYEVDHTVLPEAEDALHRAVMAARARLTLCCHADSLVTVAYSPDGSRIATASQDGTAKIWDAATGSELITLGTVDGSNAVNLLAYSPDGTRIVTGHDDHTARVWDAATGSVTLTLSGHEDYVNSVAYSPDGAHIATTSGDNTLKMWDAVTGEELYTLSESINSVAFSPDGKRFATAGGDNTARIWDVATGRQWVEFFGHTNAVSKVAFSPDGTRLATVSDDNTARVWDATTGAQQLLLNLPASGLGVAFSPDGRQLATSGFNGAAALWDATSGKEVLTLLGHSSAIYDVSFSPDGTRLATAGRDNTAKVWDITPSRESLAFLAADLPGIVSSLAYSPDGTRLATANNDQGRIWDAATGRLLLTLLGHSSDTNRVVFSSDGTRLVTTSDDMTARVWDAATGKELLTLNGHTARVVAAAFSPDGKRLATLSDDGTARIWDASTGREMLTVSWFEGVVTDLAFSPDGRYVATAGFPKSGDSSLRMILWDPLTGRQLSALSSPGRLPSAFAFRLDGRQLAVGYIDGSMKVYGISLDGLHATELFRPRGHSGWIEDLVYSPDGKRFATASDDGTTTLWEAATGQGLLTLSGHDGGVHAVGFSPDGTRLATGGVDGTVRIYLLRIEELVNLARSRLTRTWTTEECMRYLHMESCPPAPG